MKRLMTLLVLITLLAACTNNDRTTSPTDVTPISTIDSTTLLDDPTLNSLPDGKIATKLQSPWAINLFNNTFYISERNGTIAVIHTDGKTERQKVNFSSPLSNAAEAGFLGFLLKRDFKDSSEAFAYYTYDLNGAPFNRIVTLQLSGNEWNETAIHLDEIPSGNFHHGGRLAYSPDGILFATVGDAIQPQLAQDPNSINGKVIKMNSDGTFSIFTMGHRNPQGLAWTNEGILYSSEHGSSANDEINILEEGKNYGWPTIRGTEIQAGLESPILTSGPNETWAPSGMTFHKGKLYVAALRGEAILVIDPITNKLERKIEGFGRVRDVFSDGTSLYFITNNTDGRGTPSRDDDILHKMTE